MQIDQGARSAEADLAFTVNDGPVGSLQVQVDGPSTLRPGQPGVVTVNYSNAGETDVLAPVLTLAVQNALLQLPDGGLGVSVDFLGVDEEGPAGILSPGARGTFSLVFQPTTSNGSVEFGLNELLDDAVIDWSGLEEQARPVTVSDEAWAVIWANFTDDLGTTGRQYRAVLADNANHLSQLGITTSDTARLLRFEFLQASQALWQAVVVGPSTLGMSIDALATPDAQASESELPLIFSRNYDSTIDGRFRLGLFGRGWTHSWETGLSVDADGNVTITESGSARLFARQADGSYRGQAGDLSRLTLAGGLYQLEEQGGNVMTFLADGKLGSLQDRNGNRITAGYTGGRLTSLVHSDGESFAITYNARGRIGQLTDNSGRTTTYQYDASGEYLTAVIGAGGTTLYTYEDIPGGASEHALASITYADATHAYFEYDGQGRLSRSSLDAGAESVTYTYDSAGGVTLTDGDGNSSQLLLTDLGASGRVTDRLGRVTQFQYDSAGRITQVIGPDNSVTSFTYDARGNLVSSAGPARPGGEIHLRSRPRPDAERPRPERQPDQIHLRRARQPEGHHLRRRQYGDVHL